MKPEEVLRAKVPLPVAMSSEDWLAIHASIKRQAMFAAMVDELSILMECRELASQVLEGQLSKVEARLAFGEVLTKLDYMPNPQDVGTIKDLSHTQRQNLILETNMRLASGAADRATMRGSFAYPAKKLIRLSERTQKRDWLGRWRLAYSIVGGAGCAKNGEMIALNDSPVWVELSRFRTNSAPLDYNSGMGFEYLDYDEATRLGLITDEVLNHIDEQASRAPVPSDANLQAVITSLDPDLKTAAKSLLGDKLSIENDTLEWKGLMQ